MAWEGAWSPGRDFQPVHRATWASKARQAFEKAVELDGRNIEAINDLFSYYLEAPGFLGGGLNKAADLAQRIKAIDPIEYHYAMAQIADKRKDYNSAESHFRQAFDWLHARWDASLILPSILSTHGKEQESDACSRRRQRSPPTSHA